MALILHIQENQQPKSLDDKTQARLQDQKVNLVSLDDSIEPPAQDIDTNVPLSPSVSL